MQNTKLSQSQLNQSSRGFALVIALSLMAFVLLLAISLTQLISVETQSATISKQTKIARANALLGLQVALGELQRSTGADTRVTAEARILDSDPDTEIADDILHPHWNGVWNVNEMTGQRELFTWLVSGNESLSTQDTDFLSAETAVLSEDDSVELLGSESAGSSAETVRAQKVSVDAGHYAYWVSGEQTKALLNIGKEELRSLPAFPETITRQFQFDHLNLTSDPSDSTTIRKSQSLEQAALALGLDDDVLKEYYFDVTTLSRGLLTDAQQGGLTLDLTALLSMDDLPSGYEVSRFIPAIIQSKPIIGRHNRRHGTI
ncbi:hypothetical protein [Thalassobacterium sedimentorum]|nr:hypothetical protein [Coraliomargarita sp. SDUM461004]